jgi:hypothetical protein
MPDASSSPAGPWATGSVTRKRAGVLDLDECHARLYPTVAHVWAPHGEYPTLPLWDVHGKCVAFAAIDLHTGRTFHHLSRSLAGAEQLRLLDQWVMAYPGQRLLLIWDNGPTHRNKKVAAWLAGHPQVACFWFPPYSGDGSGTVSRTIISSRLLRICLLPPGSSFRTSPAIRPPYYPAWG